MCKKILFIFSLCLFAIGVNAKDIVIYHTTDIHGQYLSRADADNNQYSGFTRLATFLKQTKQPYLLLDGGGFANDAEEVNILDARKSIDLMNKIGYKAITLGDSDFNLGNIGLTETLPNFRGDILAMNIQDINLPKKEIKAHNMYKVGGIKVGVIGVAMGNTDFVTIPSTQDFEDQILSLKDAGAKVIIILAHDSMLDDEETPQEQKSQIIEAIKDAPSLGELSLVLGGHSHIQTSFGRFTNKDSKGPWILTSAPNLETVTKIIIHQDDRTGQITVTEPQFIRLEGTEDKKIQKYLDLLKEKEEKAAQLAQEKAAAEQAAAKFAEEKALAEQVAKFVAEQAEKAKADIENIAKEQKAKQAADIKTVTEKPAVKNQNKVKPAKVPQK
ncbi:MAG: metallophosphoesterase [Elusimicrobiaceae bacterium]|nr:metallophosphoesterase [Elusimicrobiaceae bacterium]